ncbi:MAG TPA: ABC transporter ATP-binding protein [Conexibacter sp.]|nr:ABC transporter ATP-binding protein [Conexibacter sp.]
MAETVLSVEGLGVELAGMEALTDVSFSVARGECLGIVGETGSGKTVTCRTLVGLERRIGGRVVRGRIVLDGTDVAGFDDAGWRAVRGRRIALVPQASLSSMDPLMRVGRQLAETVRTLDPDADPRARALELLEQVDMPRPREVLRRHPHELSGGMRQRAMIALALAGRPSLLIADEPTTALDVTVQRRILRLLTTIRQETGMAVIFVSHDLSVVRSVSDDVAIMYAGRTVERGPIEDVFAAPAHPYTQALLAAQPGLADRSAPLAAIAGAPPPLGRRPDGCPFRPRCPHAIEACAAPVPQVTVGAEHEAACVFARELVAG